MCAFPPCPLARRNLWWRLAGLALLLFVATGVLLGLRCAVGRPRASVEGFAVSGYFHVGGNLSVASLSAPKPTLGLGANISARLPNRGAAELDAICARLNRAPDEAALERVCCEYLAPWIAENSHWAAKTIDQLRQRVPRAGVRIEAEIMAAQDVVAAYAWASNLSPGAERVSALNSVLYEAAVDAPQESLVLVQGAEFGGSKPGLVQRIVLRWYESDREGALNWLAQQPETLLQAGQ